MKINYFVLVFLMFFKTFCLEIIYIIPPGGYEDERLFNLDDKKLNRDNCIKHFYDLRTALMKKGYLLKTARLEDDLSSGKYIFTSGISDIMCKKLKKYEGNLIAFIWEPPTVEFESYVKKNHSIFKRIYTMDDDFVDNKKYHKLHYPQPNLSMVENSIDFSEKKFCTLINSFSSLYLQPTYQHELYTKRLIAIEYFKNKKGFEFYGKNWEETPFGKYDCYGGLVESKNEILKNYKFCICFENTSNMNGYISEKIFDCFMANCVPIYMGAPNITQYIPSNCFIDFKKFDSYEDLYNFLINMNVFDYQIFIKNINQFLNIKAIQIFSIEYFVNQILLDLENEFN